MLVLLSFVLVLVATVLLVLGVLTDAGLPMIYTSIALSAVAGALLIVATRQARPVVTPRTAPEPLGYDPARFWAGPTSASFAALRLEPWRLRLMPGSVMLRREGEVLTWRE